jgi:hypothetical protein
MTKIMNANGAVKCESLKAQSNGHVDDELQKNLGELILKYEKLKVSSWTSLMLSCFIMSSIQYFNICGFSGRASIIP